MSNTPFVESSSSDPWSEPSPAKGPEGFSMTRRWTGVRRETWFTKRSASSSSTADAREQQTLTQRVAALKLPQGSGP